MAAKKNAAKRGAAKKGAVKRSAAKRAVKRSTVARSFTQGRFARETAVKPSDAAREALVGAIEAGAFLAKLDGPLTFGRHLRAIRQGEELSLEVFAKRLGVTRMYLSDIELGRRSVSLLRAAEWAGVLGYSAEQFVRLALQAELDEAGLALDVKVTARPRAAASTRKASRPRSESVHA